MDRTTMDRKKRMQKEIIVTENELPAEVIRAIEQGQKIQAIKLLQEATGLGLANAKVLVDKAARRRGANSRIPGPVVAETNVGSLLKILALVLVAFAFYRYYMS